MKLEDVLQDVMVSKAKAFLKPAKGYNIKGKVVFTQVTGGIKVYVDLSNVPPGKHGFHIHELAVCQGDFESAGGHFAPLGNKHGSPEDEEHHAGDLGNLTANKDGRISHSFISDSISFEGPTSIINRSVILHSGTDDFKTQPTGDSGKRIACGIIKEA